MFQSNLLAVSLVCLALLPFAALKVRKVSSEVFGRSLNYVETNSEVSEVSQKSGFHSAILVAGSEGYRNYRHQSDMCHAFQMLKKKGIPSDDIIVFVYDDIARNYYNPYPGKIYNLPDGYDVYPGCAKDYTGSNVNKEVLTAVLKGDAAAVKGKGSGRVLKKNPNQRVFFAYSDHGSVGYVPLPYGPYLYADEFNKLLIELKNNSMFKEMMVYIESCYAGSMFYGMAIEKEEDILAVSAAGPYESSYATFCPSYYRRYVETINPNKIRSCMGDLFTVAWIVDAESQDVFNTTVKSHLERVTLTTSAYGTYYGGSHVYAFGKHGGHIYGEPLGNFLAGTKSFFRNVWSFVRSGSTTNTQEENFKQTDADLVFLYQEASKNNNSDASLKLEKELAMRRHTDEVIYNSLNSLIRSGDLPTDTPVSKFAEEAIPRGQGEPVVNDWDCLRGMVDAWEDKCGRLNSYSGLYSRTFVNLCNTMVTPAAFKESIKCQQSVYVEWDPQ